MSGYRPDRLHRRERAGRGAGGASGAGRRLGGALVGMVLAVALPGAATRLEPSRAPWTRLTFEASKLGISTRSEVTLARVTAGEVNEVLIVPAQGEAYRPEGPVLRLDVSSRFLGRYSTSEIWFEPTSGLTYQRRQLDTGKRRRYKLNRFTEDGVLTLRRYPAKGENGDDPDGWSDRSERFYPFPERLSPAVEPGVLLYMASAAPLEKPGESLQIVMFSRRDVATVELRVVQVTEVRVDYEERSAVGSRRVRGRVPAREIAVRALGGSEPVELLGLEGDVDVFLDLRSGVPLQVSGRVDIVGRVNVRLAVVELG